MEGIDSLMRHVGDGIAHMHNIHDRKDRDKIISKLNFDGKQCIAFCYRIEFDEMVKRMSNMIRIEPQGTVPMDFTDEIEELLKSRLK